MTDRRINLIKSIKSIKPIKLFFGAVCLLLFFTAPLSVHADELTDSYAELYGDAISGEGADIAEKSLAPYADGFTLSELLSRISAGDIPLDAKGVSKELGSIFFGRAGACAKKMLAAASVIILNSLLMLLSGEFKKNGAAKAANYVCFIVVAAASASVFYDCISTAETAIENLTVFMRCIVPVMLSALAASGAAVTAAALEPVLLAIIEISVSLISSVFMPVTMISTGLGIINALSEHIKTSGLIGFLNASVKYGLSVLLTIFVAFAGLRSIGGSGADALTLKLTKFASSNLVPVVGGILSDTVDTVMRCSSVIKNSVGILGVMIVFFVVVSPILSIAAALLIFRLTAALCEPVASEPLVKCVTSMADGISNAFSMLISVSVMFIIIITIMINIAVT